jgi:hypothetical protein
MQLIIFDENLRCFVDSHRQIIGYRLLTCQCPGMTRSDRTYSDALNLSELILWRLSNL